MSGEHVNTMLQIKKLLGCRDPSCKHENPSVTIMFDKFIYQLHEVTWSYIKLHEVVWCYMKLREVLLVTWLQMLQEVKNDKIGQNWVKYRKH